MKNSSTKQLMLWLNESVARPTTRHFIQSYARRYSTMVGLVCIGGYPKSGTTWISKMIAYYLGLPWVGHTDLAIGFPSVVHHHWDYHPTLDGSTFIVRDGRDVIVSIYLNLIKGYLATETSFAELGVASPGRLIRSHFGRYARLRHRFQSLYGSSFEPEDTLGNLPKFIESEMEKPFISEARTSWPDYVSSWLNRPKHVTVIKYEDMLEQPEAVLGSLLRILLQEEPNSEDILYVVQRFSFSRMTGRSPGEESRQSFARKGISGDWINHFSPEACQVFDSYAGNLLIELGYESDHQWIHSLSAKSDTAD